MAQISFRCANNFLGFAEVRFEFRFLIENYREQRLLKNHLIHTGKFRQSLSSAAKQHARWKIDKYPLQNNLTLLGYDRYLRPTVERRF